QIVQEEKQRLEDTVKKGALPGTKMVELDYQQRRFEAAVQAYRHDLAARGLTPEQVRDAAEGKFVTEVTVAVPKRAAAEVPFPGTVPTEAGRTDAAPPLYEVEELKAGLGEQVQAGQTLCLLANHEGLYVEGRAFKQEAPLMERAAQQGWP